MRFAIDVDVVWVDGANGVEAVVTELRRSYCGVSGGGDHSPSTHRICWWRRGWPCVHRYTPRQPSWRERIPHFGRADPHRSLDHAAAPHRYVAAAQRIRVRQLSGGISASPFYRW